MNDERVPGLVALLDRFRAGDAGAAIELVRAYEPHLRRIIRLRIRDSRLRRLYDSADICQSVLASFFARLSLGQFDLESPAQLVRLLEIMARNKLATEARKANVTRRVEVGAVASPGGVSAVLDRPAPGPSVTEQVAWREMVEMVRVRLSDDERAISDMRAAGCEWSEIAARLDGGPDAVRKRLERAFDRVARELGWEG
ncbi:RNA polymerase sigma factor [Aquisphaera insulae]|uniref:RNA polymerase sigma factor n=1 Tax=Aquisphaera insulae TaxID=2712864 RepID=UPI0013EB4A23|nr:ECF-type sigma factor [Aquisphaera insulae]